MSSKPQHPILPTSFRFLVVAAAFMVVVAGLRAAQAICVPFLVALFLAVISRPLVEALIHRRVPRWLAVGLAMAVIALVLVSLGYLMSLSLSRVTTRLPQYQTRFQEELNAGLAWLNARGVDTAVWITPESLGPTAVVDVITGTFRGVANLLTAVFLILLMTFFLLLESRGFEGKLQRALGRQGDDDGALMERFGRITEEVQRYLLIKTLVSLATGVCIGLWVAFLGLDFPLLWGLLAFLLNYIPNIGSFLAALPAVLLAVVQLGPSEAFLVALGYLATNVLWGNLVEPQVLGRRLRLSPLAVFLSLIFWGWVWGPMGMLLSVPITMVLKIAMENSRGFRWLAVLLNPA